MEITTQTDTTYDPNDLVSISEYARIVNKNRRTIYNWIQNGSLSVIEQDGRPFLLHPIPESERTEILPTVSVNEDEFSRLSVSDLFALIKHHESQYYAFESNSSASVAMQIINLCKERLNQKIKNLFIY